MPLTLRSARQARGWSQNRLLYEVENFARQRAISLAGSASLKVYISQWENGHRIIGDPYRHILRVLLGLTDEELAGDPPGVPQFVDGYAELASRIDAAHGISRTAVRTLREQTEAFRTLDRQLGASQLVDSIGQHIEMMSGALTFAVLPDARQSLAESLAGAATLAAWQALDAGAAERAWQRYELAKQAAREAEQPRFLAHAMGEQAYVLADAGRLDLALQLIGAALQVRGRIPPRLTAWLLSVQAELHALSGDVAACHRILAKAARALPADNVLRDPDLPSIFLTEQHLTRWQGHALALIGDEQSVSNLYATLATMDQTFTRAQAGVHCDLAQAHLMRREFSEAAEHLRSARRLANRTGSVRYRRRLEALTYRLPS